MIKNTRKKNIMRKRIALILITVVSISAAIIVTLFAMSSSVSGSPTVQSAPSIDQNDTPPPAAVPGINLPLQNLNGNWSADSGNGATMTAVIQDEQITITLNNEGAKAIYWVGTFKASTGSGDIVTSNKIEVRKAVLSKADSKNFSIGDSTISFELTAMGKTTTIMLHRV